MKQLTIVLARVLSNQGTRFFYLPEEFRPFKKAKFAQIRPSQPFAIDRRIALLVLNYP